MPRPMKKQQPLVPKKDADAPSSVNAKDDAQPVKARPKAQAAPSNDELTVDLLRERRFCGRRARLRLCRRWRCV